MEVHLAVIGKQNVKETSSYLLHIYRRNSSYLPHTILKEHDHAHPAFALLDELHNGFVVGLLHVAAIYGKYDIALAHSCPVGWSSILHIVHVCDHLQLLVPLIVDTVALKGESIGIVFLFNDNGAPPTILIRLGGEKAFRFITPQDMG